MLSFLGPGIPSMDLLLHSTKRSSNFLPVCACRCLKDGGLSFNMIKIGTCSVTDEGEN